MPLHPDVEHFLQQLAAFGAPRFSTQTPEQARAQMEQLGAMGAQLGGPLPFDIAVADRRIPSPAGEIPVRIYTPAETAAQQAGQAPGNALRPGLVYFHGGGWVLGSIETYDRECRQIAHQAGCVLVSVDYRLAPEHKFPAAPDDCLFSTRWVAAHAAELGIDAKRLAVGGDSAGGNLAAVVAQQLRDGSGEPALICQLLIYPATDAAGDYPSKKEPGIGFLHPEDAGWFMNHYLSQPDEYHDPRVSPLRASSLAGLPHAIVAVCEYDPLRDEGIAYARALQAAGVPTEELYFPGHIHGFTGLAAVVPSARIARDQLLSALRRVLHGC